MLEWTKTCIPTAILLDYLKCKLGGGADFCLIWGGLALQCTLLSLQITKEKLSALRKT